MVIFPGLVNESPFATRPDRREPFGKRLRLFKLRVDDNFPGLVNEAPTAPILTGASPSGKHSGIFKLRIDGVFAVRTDVAEATAAADVIG